MLARDISGIQGLFWTKGRNDSVLASTDLDVLRSKAPGTWTIDRAGLHEYLRFFDISAPRTIFNGIHAVIPGRRLEFAADGRLYRDDEITAERYPTPASFNDAISLLESFLRSAIEQNLRGASRPAVFLSGGVDSALIAAIAASLRPDLTAVTVGFKDSDLDESGAAGAIASRLGIRHEILRFDRSALMSAYERAATGSEQPTADPTLPATILALEYCREHFDALLDGTGADEAVGSIPARHLRLSVSVGGRLPAPWRRLLVRAMRAIPGARPFVPIFDFEHPAEPFIRWRGFGREEIERLCGERVSLEQTHFYQTFERFALEAHFERYSALMDAMPSERVTQAMRITAFRMSFPYADHRVNAYCRQLPKNFRALPNQPKRLLRGLLARYLASDVWDRPKKGFTFPVADFLQTDGGRFVREQLDRDLWRSLNVVDCNEVERLMQGFLAGDERWLFRVWGLAVLGAWLVQHREAR